jgi:Reverse transcriptase (RNA-dependent DNA polymerase)
MVYASVVGRETVRIALTIAALNDLQVKATDIENAYLNAPNKEKTWVVLGPEGGDDVGKKAIIVRAQYGLRSAGAAHRSHLAECLRSLGYQPCQADPDLWYKAAIRPEDGFEYYSYLVDTWTIFLRYTMMLWPF